MHFSTLLLPLLTLSTTTLSVTAAHVPAQPAHRRHAPHVAEQFEKIRREGTIHHEAREGIPHVAQKGKRLVKKKKRSSTCGTVSTGNTTLSSSAGSWSSQTTASSTGYSSATVSATTSVIGDNDWASYGAASSKTSATASSITASSTAAASSTTASSTTATSAAASSSAASSSNSDWTLTDSWKGNTFFDNWDFWSYSDPTHGTVAYQDAGHAWDEGLVSTNSAGNAVIKVDTTQTVTGGRKAVRLHGKKTWTGGMVIFDAAHMPTGCGTWPAWWQNGPNWPTGGEIDILEGVNAFSQNQVSLHTASGCTMPSDTNSNQKATLTTGSFDSLNCASYETSNQGCGARDMSNEPSYGAPFNAAGGGVYVMIWDKSGISVYFFQRSAIPADITNEKPDPSSWGTPVAFFSSESCDPYKFFYDHFNIINTTFCGDWAGADAVWNYAGYAGQDQSCAAITGHSTCSDYVLNSGSSFSEAYWEIGYVKYFTSPTLV